MRNNILVAIDISTECPYLIWPVTIFQYATTAPPDIDLYADRPLGFHSQLNRTQQSKLEKRRALGAILHCRRVNLAHYPA
jgi:hypothetical protein